MSCNESFSKFQEITHWPQFTIDGASKFDVDQGHFYSYTTVRLELLQMYIIYLLVIKYTDHLTTQLEVFSVSE